MSLKNRMGNCHNPYQGSYKKVLCVCSAGLLRSPTAAVVLSQEPFNFNTRAVGTSEEYALIHLDSVHIEWADEIVCMEKSVAQVLVNAVDADTPVRCLNIEDSYDYRDPELMRLIAERYDQAVPY